MFENFDLMSDGLRIVLFLAILSLWIACFVINKKAMDGLKANNMGEMKTQVEQLRNATWALYAVYLIYYFQNLNRPILGMMTGRSSIGIIGLVLSTILVLCITHLSNTCMDGSCDAKMAQSHLDRVNILLSVLVVVHIGTIVVFMLSPSSKIGFTAEILELLRTPSNRRSFQRRSPILHSGIDYY
jgi:hypothetical protein